jgi:hypothetical protein
MLELVITSTRKKEKMSVREITKKLNEKFEFMNLSSPVEFKAKYRLNKIYVLAEYVPSSMLGYTLDMLHENLDELKNYGIELDISVNDKERN